MLHCALKPCINRKLLLQSGCSATDKCKSTIEPKAMNWENQELQLNRRHILAIALSSFAAQRSNAANNKVYPKLGRGLSFHHMLNWPAGKVAGGDFVYAWPAFAQANYSTSENELRRLKDAGFDFIRLTADPAIMIAANAAQHLELFDHYRKIIALLIAHGFSVVFDLHPVSENPRYAPDKLMANAGGAFDGLVQVVGQVAKLLSDFPPQSVALELMNEPPLMEMGQAHLWQAMVERLHTAARTAAAELALVFGGIFYNDRKGLFALDLRPFAGSNVLYTYHYYSPHYYTHQGVAGDEGQFVGGVVWPVTPESASKLYRMAQERIARTPKADAAVELPKARQVIEGLVGARHTPATINSHFAEVSSWADANQIAHDRILLGEFGCTMSALDVPLGPDRLLWLSTVRKAAEAQGFAWAYWAYKGYGGMELVSDKGEWHIDVLEALGLKSS